ncbi:hypothetical protein B0H19DRAFT_1168745 [Mycena capillaripes]|nr:hypothetical protein B0H19DRAFT_1168745 [Mycena capillaripes]
MLLARRSVRGTGVLLFTSIVLFTVGFYHRREQEYAQRNVPPPVQPPPNPVANTGDPKPKAPLSASPTTEPVVNAFDSGGGPKLNDTLYFDSESSRDWNFQAWRTPSQTAYRKLLSCLETSSCNENQKKVMIVQSMYFRNRLRGGVGGEEIFAHSTMAAMDNLGYTVLHTENLREAVQVYRLLPTMVKVVIVDDWDSFRCWKDKENCLRTDQNPTGIPGYKLLSFYFWPFPRHPLGPRWILSPEPYHLQTASESLANNTYLGYSIEESCRKQKFFPPDTRPSPPRAWVLAKLLSYFVPEKNQFRAWSKEDLDSVAEQTGFEFMMAAAHSPDSSDEDIDLTAVLPDQTHYVNHGRIQQPLFMEKLAQSRVVIGMGLPLISPTPWNALCMGVPFINPVNQWDAENPDDSSKWRSQHPLAALLPKPYVYNVRKGDRQGLIKAVKDALANPIESYVPETMRMESIQQRMADVVDTDWKAEEQKLAEWCKEPCGCQQPCDAHMFGNVY